MTPQNPSVGRVVHYLPRPIPQEDLDRGAWHRSGQPWPAIITEVHDDGRVRLDLITPFGQIEERLDENNPGLYWFAEFPTPGYWSWPPRS